MLFKIGVLKNFANLTGKYLRWSFFLIKLQLQAWKAQVFSCQICEIFNNNFFYKTPLTANSDRASFSAKLQNDSTKLIPQKILGKATNYWKKDCNYFELPILNIFKYFQELITISVRKWNLNAYKVF